MLIAIDAITEEGDPAEASAVSVDLARHVRSVLHGVVVDHFVPSLDISNRLDRKHLAEVQESRRTIVPIGSDRHPEVIALTIDRTESAGFVVDQLTAHVVADGVATATEHDVGSVVGLAPELCQSLGDEDPEWLDIACPHRRLRSHPAKREVSPSLMAHRHGWRMPAVVALECAGIGHDVSACRRELSPDVWSIGELGLAFGTAVSCRLADCSLIDLSVWIVVEQMLP